MARLDPLQATDRRQGIVAAIQTPVREGSESYDPDVALTPGTAPVLPVHGIYTVGIETNDANTATFIIPMSNMPPDLQLVAEETELTLLAVNKGWPQFSDVTWKVIGWTDRVYGGEVNGVALNLVR